MRYICVQKAAKPSRLEQKAARLVSGDKVRLDVRIVAQLVCQRDDLVGRLAANGAAHQLDLVVDFTAEDAAPMALLLCSIPKIFFLPSQGFPLMRSTGHLGRAAHISLQAHTYLMKKQSREKLFIFSNTCKKGARRPVRG